jgi:tetratricopeptide (TPR) repeat protein
MNTSADNGSESSSWHDRYLALIHQIVQTTLKGEIRSKEQVYQLLVQDIDPSTQAEFERCVSEQLNTVQTQLKTEPDELKQAKLTRTQRALKTIQEMWERWQTENRTTSAIALAVQQILATEPADQLTQLLQAIDFNQVPALTSDQIRQLAVTLKQVTASGSDLTRSQRIQQLATGLVNGLQSWQALEGYLVTWWLDPALHSSLGFGGSEYQTPWALWAKQINSPFLKQVFQSLNTQQLVSKRLPQVQASLADWVELALVLQRLQVGLVNWCEQQPYDSQWGRKQAIAAFIAFSVLTLQLPHTLAEISLATSLEREQLQTGYFQLTLQILRQFAQRDYFPLYGGIFASFAGTSLRDALNYLDAPLRPVERTQVKARILTLLGYSQFALGQYEQATDFYQTALEIAQEADDQMCEVANLNHLSRTCIALNQWAESTNYSQRALILARQLGDQLGEANALANWGYSEVCTAQALERSEPETYERAIEYLQQGLKRSEQLSDRQSQAFCSHSLGAAYIALEQYAEAIPYLAQGIEFAQRSGDFYLLGLNYYYLAEAYYGLKDLEQTVLAGSVSTVLLEQIGSSKWRQAAGLLAIVQGHVGVETFQTLLERCRPQILAIIGVDGYDHSLQLLAQYRQSQ